MNRDEIQFTIWLIFVRLVLFLLRLGLSRLMFPPIFPLESHWGAGDSTNDSPHGVLTFSGGPGVRSSPGQGRQIFIQSSVVLAEGGRPPPPPPLQCVLSCFQ